MRKLQKKYEKVKKQNLVDQQEINFQSQSSPTTKQDAHTERRSQTDISETIIMNQS
jgi:hypothetical protein